MASHQTSPQYRPNQLTSWLTYFLQYPCQYFHISLQNGCRPHLHSVSTFCYFHSSCKLILFSWSTLYFCLQSGYTFFILPKDSSLHAKFGFHDWIWDLALYSVVHFRWTSRLITTADTPSEKDKRLLQYLSICVPHYQKAVIISSFQFITSIYFLLISHIYNSVSHNSLFW